LGWGLCRAPSTQGRRSQKSQESHVESDGCRRAIIHAAERAKFRRLAALGVMPQPYQCSGGNHERHERHENKGGDASDGSGASITER
jgi:hypothetical protein